MAKSEKKHRRGRGFKLSLAVAAGFYVPVRRFLDQSQSGKRWDISWANLPGHFIPWDFSKGNFSTGGLKYGLYPIAIGFLVHKLAGIFGVNRALGRMKVPLVRI